MMVGLILSAYMVCNLILMFLCLYDDIQRGGDGKPEHPVAFTIVFLLLGAPIMLIQWIIEVFKNNVER